MSRVYHATPQSATQLLLFPLTKVCTACGKEKALDDFHKQQCGLYERRSTCKECRKAGNQPTPLVPFPLVKVCATCEKEKSLDEFTPQVDGKYGRRSVCKECFNAKDRAKREAEYAAEHALDPIPHPGYKFCITCGEEKLFEAYSQGRNECRKCRVAYAKANTERRKDTPEYQEWRREYHSHPAYKAKNRAHVRRWAQTPRGRELANASARRHNQTPTRKEFDRQRRLTPAYKTYHRDYARSYARLYPTRVSQVRMRREARKKLATLEKVNYQHILERDGFWCYVCYTGIDPTLKKKNPGSLAFDHCIPLAPRLGDPKGTHSACNIHPTHLVCNMRKSNKPLDSLTAFDRRGPTL